jgi:hypothetical protein
MALTPWRRDSPAVVSACVHAREVNGAWGGTSATPSTTLRGYRAGGTHSWFVVSPLTVPTSVTSSGRLVVHESSECSPDRRLTVLSPDVAGAAARFSVRSFATTER